VAAYGFQAVSAHTYKTIIILAPSHFYSFKGISIWEEGAFETPLGLVEVDKNFVKDLTSQDDDITKIIKIATKQARHVLF